MAKTIELPKLSPTMEEGTLVRWAKNVGDTVEIDDLIAEVETDKATMEFRAFDKGVLLKQLVAEGETAKLGQPVAIFGAAGESVDEVAPATPAKGSSANAGEEIPPPNAPADPSPIAAPTTPHEAASASPASASVAARPGVAGLILQPTEASAPVAGSAPSTPRVRKLAREQGIDLDAVKGSGAHGRVSANDLTARAPGAPASAAKSGDVARPASAMRKTIARRLTEAKRDVPHFYLEADLDVEALVALRAGINAALENGGKVSVTDLLLKACALALHAVPESNASWIDGTIVQHGRVDISLAVAIDDGLVTPVIRDVDAKTVRAIASEARALATLARDRKLTLEQMQGGVFSLSNLGMFGIDRFSAVINPPEGMILAVGATRDVPVVREGAVVPGKRCAVTLSCDHRVVDGALGARFLQAVRALVENPLRLLV